MRGVDPQAVVQRIAKQLDTLRGRGEVEAALDELEYVFEVLDPEFQDGASYLIDRLRAKLEQADEG